MSETVDIKAIANITLNDLAEAIAQLEVYEVSDFFLRVAEKQDNFAATSSYAQALSKKSVKQFNK